MTSRAGTQTSDIATGKKGSNKTDARRGLACPRERGVGDDRHAHRQPLLDHVRGLGREDDGRRRGDHGRNDGSSRRPRPAPPRRHGAALEEPESAGTDKRGGRTVRQEGGGELEKQLASLRTCNGWDGM